MLLSAITLGIDAEDFAAGLQLYTGVGRRFELKQHWHGADVYDDYAHHPSEIAAALQAAQEMKAGRVICVFQPHTYSRTVSLLQDFAQALQLADQCILCPIFAARETNTWGVSSADLAALIPGAVCAENLEDAAAKLQILVQEGDIVFTMGAGDVFRVNDYLK